MNDSLDLESSAHHKREGRGPTAGAACSSDPCSGSPPSPDPSGLHRSGWLQEEVKVPPPRVSPWGRRAAGVELARRGRRARGGTVTRQKEQGRRQGGRAGACPPPLLRTGSSKKHELKSKQKLEKKLSFYTKVKDAVVTLNANKTISKKKKQRSRSRQKKLKAYDLSALGEFLPETTVPELKTEAKLNCKSRQTLVLRESAQLQAVLNNPQFQHDPFAAIHQHLLATQPPDSAKMDDAAKHGKDSRDKKRRRKKKKASSGSQSMEI
ncbi:hypothetical protein PR202_ga03615 [Eleusine coracana subsp. coracana]|uniref:Ribosome biogenesis protein slx9-like n=1 Tax=Eleusine coracana subsp. coracana TaxID=191504 RepID=A0AAV5BQV5_ELECO|nr:hypothetical protein PR202_ga03615 [Eleusine coracana subsp. coracana]